MAAGLVQALKCAEGFGPELTNCAAYLLGGSWVVISSVISRITMVITYISGLITPLITTHESPSDGEAS